MKKCYQILIHTFNSAHLVTKVETITTPEISLVAARKKVKAHVGKMRRYCAQITPLEIEVGPVVDLGTQAPANGNDQGV